MADANGLKGAGTAAVGAATAGTLAVVAVVAGAPILVPAAVFIGGAMLIGGYFGYYADSNVQAMAMGVAAVPMAYEVTVAAVPVLCRELSSFEEEVTQAAESTAAAETAAAEATTVVQSTSAGAPGGSTAGRGSGGASPTGGGPGAGPTTGAGEVPSPGPLTNASGPLEDAANAARNQPHGPAPAAAESGTSTIAQNAANGRAFEQRGLNYLERVQNNVADQVSVRPTWAMATWRIIASASMPLAPTTPATST